MVVSELWELGGAQSEETVFEESPVNQLLLIFLCFCFVFLLGGHMHQCSGLSSGSVPKDYYWWDSRDHRDAKSQI